MRRTRWLGFMAAIALAPLLGACGQANPSAGSLLHSAARVMRGLSYQLSGTDRAGTARVTFSVRERANGDFSGSVDFRVPPSPVLTTQVVSVGGRVYVLSAGALAQLGVTSLPGNLNPAVTWVLQPAKVGQRYRQSVSSFVGSGLATTLLGLLKGEPTVSPANFQGRQAWLLQESPKGGPRLRLYLARGAFQVLSLSISGPQGVALSYRDFGAVPAVTPPPPSRVYVPPSPGPGS